MSIVEVPKELWPQLAGLPASKPPPDVEPNFENPTWHGGQVVIPAAIFVTIMFFVSAVRIYTKCYIVRKWSWEDSKNLCVRLHVPANDLKMCF